MIKMDDEIEPKRIDPESVETDSMRGGNMGYKQRRATIVR